MDTNYYNFVYSVRASKDEAMSDEDQVGDRIGYIVFGNLKMVGHVKMPQPHKSQLVTCLHECHFFILKEGVCPLLAEGDCGFVNQGT